MQWPGVIQQLIGLFHTCFVLLFTLFFLTYLCGRRSRPQHHEFTGRTVVTHTIDTLDKCEPAILMSKFGKCVSLTKKHGLKLVAKSVQNAAIMRNLVIWRIGHRIALLFKYDDCETYVVTVNQSELQLIQLTQTTDDAVKAEIQNLEPWFQIENVHNHYYCIRAENGNKYLTLLEGSTPHLTLSDEQNLTSTFRISPYSM